MGRIPLVFSLTLGIGISDTLLKTTAVMSGKIKQILIDIPAGSAFNAGIRFVFGKAGVLPIEDAEDTTEKYFTGDETKIPLKPDIMLNEEKIKIYGKNNGASAHTFIVTMEIEE